ncbi:prolyl oligopeptidase family serine peptidase [Mangrovimonas sp. AS39]|uniref:S9 family peptidase n=1 Tax=Mangrovimonas futianensis TaxID=2895523 RepID=UPI001E4EF6F1|nr:prolyl oligopeptidase family serine peptidase [Mangrovimonas futianensis]MCF1192001.1 prolyl oligopeptidase family serine peptidase [Mangrovimonas futianensis]MCF1195695.1 prolyl oligopeptidase family serine peptidase [Mangrovimonas futianensis]
MKQSILLIFVLILVSCKNENQTKETETAQREIPQYTIEQFMDNESVGGGSFSHDNSKLLISSNKSGIYNAYTVSTQGGDYTPITASDSTSYFAQSFFPSDDRMLLSADGNGDEIDHIYLRDTTGTLTDLTPEKEAKSQFLDWTEDKQGFYYLSNKRDPKYFDVYKMDINTFKPSLIYQNNDGMNFSAISGDEQYIALSQSINSNDSDLYLYNMQTKESTKINDQLSANSAQGFSKDNTTLYYTTDDGQEFSYLMAYDLSTKEKSIVVQKDWDVMGAGFTENGTYMIVYVNEDGKNAVEVTETATKQPLDLPDFGQMSITSVSFSDDEKWMRLYVGGSNTPSDLYTYNIENKALHRITNVLNKDINIDDLVTAQVVRYKSFDGTVIPAIYYLPHQASKDHKVPAMVWVHGGPGGQTRQSYFSLLQYMVNHGYAVLAVNNRGSSGYGKTFYKMDDLNHGEKDLQDCVEGKNWLQTQPEIDADKIGIIGGSYGGYMTMAALTYTPEEFNVGVNLFGVTNWMRTLKSIPPYWESFRKSLYLELGDPYSADSVRLKRISPLFHTDKVTKPLMVLQGAQDPRVLQVESDEIVAGVRENGVPVEYVLFEDEGHGFVKKENQIEAYSKVVDFLDEYLKNPTKKMDGELPQADMEAVDDVNSQ